MGALNVAVIGCGRQGKTLIASLLLESLPDVRIQALCDIWPRNVKEAQDILIQHARTDLAGHTYEDYRQLLEREKGLHAAIIATPDGAHATQTMDCLKAGLHVYCEAPISNDVELARRMVRASRETGKLLQIGHQRRSDPYYRQARRLIHETSLLGQLNGLQRELNIPASNSNLVEVPADAIPDSKTLERYGYGNAKEFLNWRSARRHGGGLFLSEATHTIDTVSWLLGCTPCFAVVSGGRERWRDREPFDTVSTILQYAMPSGDVRMMDALSGKHGSKRNAIILHGVKGYLYLSDIPGSSFAKAEGWLARNERGEHPWDMGIQKDYAIHLRDSPLLIDKAKYMTQEGLSGVEQMRMQIRYWHRYRSRCALLDSILLARSSPWESPLPEVLVLKPLPQGGIAEARPPKSPFGPHLSNFIEGIRGTEKLNCPAEVGYPSAVIALEILKALETDQHEVAFGKRTVE